MKFLKMMMAALLLSAAGTGFAATPNTSPVERGLPLVTVHKSPYCGCCEKWIEHMQAAGFEVEVVNTEDMTPVKQRVGIPPGKGSCHTAEVGGYFVEGHVPADDVKRMLAEKPAARGIAVPGMPIGSPGMESPDGRVQAYEVQLIDKDGLSSTYSTHAASE
ncbi:DUF411 domain-containing protein [Arenimonas metalli]|uniref:DUF411 domain-containing protein n=1 Tax=Arenimonas metalli CF5-1 TaxID=1384056 RepID=A0A091BRZ8_9GAMM|nr:DUF411 domain-containing protein [Arenimonas metalli]KFN47105.1 hypothetical protein N787_02030 [Arenimonas metalli CF5-1]